MTIHRLKPGFVDKVTDAGMYADGGGLYLQVGEGGGAKSWIFRYSRVRFGKRGEAHMGLGPTHTIGLNDARELARECRRTLLQGTEPLEARRADRLTKQLEAAKQVTFASCAEEYCAHKSKTWVPRTARSAARQIRQYLYPKFEKMLIGAIDHLQVEHVIKPLWEQKPPTATLVRMHLEAILDRAKARGYRTGDNPASLKGPLGILLSDIRNIHVVTHHASMPYQEIGTFMTLLRDYKSPHLTNGISVTGELLQFIILTAVRIDEARGMRWGEIDWPNRLWTCPWRRTKPGKKTKKDHLVPLSDPALAILRKMQAIQSEDGIQSDFVFVHNRPGDQEQLEHRIRRGGRELTGRLISSEGVVRFLKRSMARNDLTVHGFRSTFSAWANDLGRNREAIEMTLDHAIGSKVERIYARDAQRLEQRRKLLEEWGEFCGRTEPLAGSILPFRQPK
jgi:integrase